MTWPSWHLVSLFTTWVVCAPCVTETVWADVFTIRLDDGSTVQITARFAGAGHKAQALELADGRLQLVPEQRVLTRVAGPDPEPLSLDQMQAQLEEEFDAARLVVEVDKPFLIALIRARTTPAEPNEAKLHRTVVKKAAQFFRGMQVNFLQFVKQARVETVALKYPLVALIFESDRQFDAYTTVVTGQEGMSPENIAAFYDLLSNRLVIRLRECQSFDTPLHEAVHQQVYNRGVLQRLAPVPAWFNEGIATGFEGDGERVRSGPRSISDRYGQMALQARKLSWKALIADDRAFQGDVLAAEAYGQAWGLHWLLVTKYRTAYYKLVRHYSQKLPLAEERADQRIQEFEDIVGKSIEDLHAEFLNDLPRAMAKRTR